MDNTALYTKLSSLPENLKNEVSDFIDFLMSKTDSKKNTTKAKFGSAKGMFKMKDNFDDPIDDFNEYVN